MKLVLILMMVLTSGLIQAEELCDVRPGQSVSVKIMEFASGNTIHSKMTMKEATPDALLEEMINLQDMGVCAEKIISRQCILKFEKAKQSNILTLYRGKDKWGSWLVASKKQAQDYVKNLKRVGFCS